MQLDVLLHHAASRALTPDQQRQLDLFRQFYTPEERRAYLAKELLALCALARQAGVQQLSRAVVEILETT